MKNKAFYILIIFAIFLMTGKVSYAQNVVVETEEGVLFVYDDQGKRDPFLPLVGKGGEIRTYEMDFLPTDLHLEGIMYAEDNKGVAIINGKVVKANKKIGKYTVLEIQSEMVILIKDNQRHELNLKKGE